MKKLQIRLLLCLITFSIILVSVVTFTNRELLRKDIKAEQQKSWELIENHILSDMTIIDNAHYYFDSVVSEQLETELRKMAALYEENPDVSKWDLEALKAQHGYEIYILDETNTVIHTTFTSDLGLSFSACCSKFSAGLDKRRLSGEYYSDAINISTTTGELWKYSYLATPDKKYLLELGLNASNVDLFQKFNFFKTATDLNNKYNDLLEVRILNSGGYYLDANPGEDYKIKHEDERFKEAYEKALQTMEPVEYTDQLADGYMEISRFIPYQAEQVRGASTKRVIYMKYGNSNELASLERNIQQFWLILVIAIVTSLILLVVISGILTKTIRLATFDPLTGVNNRASYVNVMDELLQRKRKDNVGLLLVDLDNFKQVNDQYGHMEGDRVLVETGAILKNVVKKEGIVARFGGDEFAIVLPNTTVDRIEAIAHEVLQAFRMKKKGADEAWEVLSISVGGALQQEEKETEAMLFTRADKALYQSKNRGKDCYTMYGFADK
ncbi:GGDEF domain-containing protein [Lysinibacillus sp. KU-BSD001]|uniref:GGDEF domain-containing protein n=1 Tax=Lysinibacillus sp. KU-BSD001 TaxID=3141328 RepID=UPI0036E5D133